MFLAISLALPIYSMAQTTLTLESYTTGDRISGGPIKTFSMGPDNNLVVYLDGPFNFADLVVPIWIQTSGTCSSTPPVPYPPPSVTGISGSNINFLVCCPSANATLSMVVDPDPGITTVNGAVPATNPIPSFPSPLTIGWNTAGIPSGSYLAVFQATDTATPPHTSQLVVMININPPETVSTPAVSGPAVGSVNQSYTFTVTTPSTVTPSGDPVQYFFDWGDGSNSGWVSTTTAAKIWATANTYSVKVQARCATHPSVVSAWSGTSPITISTIPAYLLTVNITPSGGGTVSVNGQPYTSSLTFSSGTVVNLSASAAQGYNFSSWSGDTTGTSPTTTVTMTGPKTLTATFTQQPVIPSGDFYTWGEKVVINLAKDTEKVYKARVPENSTRFFLTVIGTTNETYVEYSWILPDGTVFKPFNEYKITGTDVYMSLQIFSPPAGDHTLILRATQASYLIIRGSCF